MTQRPPSIGYLPKGYPRISETFISGEILELERLGLEISIYSLKRPGESIRQPCAQQVRSPVVYLPEKIVRWLPLLLPVHLALWLRRPRGYTKALRWTLSHCRRRRSTTTLRRFFQAGWLVGWLLRGRTIPHFHAHFCHGPATVAMFVKWMTGSTFSFTAHAKDIYLTRPDTLREKMREAEFVLTCTGYNRRYLGEIGGDLVPVHLVYHGIDVGRFSRASREQIVPLRSYVDGIRIPMLLSVGRLVEKKGFDTLIHACALLRDRGLRFRCVIFGEGPERSALESMIRSLNLGGIVELPGGILQDELLEVYRQAEVFALPCQVLENGDRDGLPNVLVEAMAMQIPVVSTEVSGVPELVEHGVNGFLVPPRSPEPLADRIHALLRDASLRRRFGEAGRRRVTEEFDQRRNTRRLLALFQEALGLPPVGSEARPEPAPVARREGSV
ncbi:MAG: glycosyltransferase [Candidatus Krumholzibacteriia bacterium]